MSDSWTLGSINVGIGEDPTFSGLSLAAGGAFGFIDDDSTVERVYSIAEVSITPSIEDLRAKADPDPDDGVFVAAFAGSFAGVTSDAVSVANFVLERGESSQMLPLVGDGPDTGISALTEAQFLSITPFHNAGWSIVTPATANTVPSGPENEVWVMGNIGQCPPVLWWQWDDVKDLCFDVTATSGGGDNQTSNNASGSTRPGTTSSPAPSGEAGPDESPVFLRPFTAPPSTEDADLPDQPDQATDPDTDADTDTAAGGDTTSGESASDNGAAAQSSAGFSTGALWAIGLGVSALLR